MVQTRRKDDDTSYLSPNRRRRSNVSSDDDDGYAANSRPRRHCTREARTSHAPENVSSDIDDDASDESLFLSRARPTRSSRHIGLRSLRSSSMDGRDTSNGHAVVSTEEDPHLGVRRSTRTRKCPHDAMSTSWIMGSTTPLLGYPKYKADKIQLSAEEGISKRASRCSRYSSRESTLPQQAAKNSSTMLKSKHSVKHEAKEEVEEGEENEEGSNNSEQGLNDEKIDDGEIAEPNGNVSSSNDGSNNHEERRNDEGIKRLRSSRTRSRLNTESDHLKMDDKFPDMYSRVKRARRPVTRFSFTPGRRRMNQHQTSSDSDESEDSDRGQPGKRRTRGSTRKYQLRAHKPAIDRFQAHHEPVRRSQRSFQKVFHDSVLRQLGHRPTNRYSQNSSSSSSDSDARFDHKKTHGRHVPHNFHSKDGAKVAGHHFKDVKAATLADIDPMALDTSIRFEHVGGLEEHIRCLQEMVVFPVLYKDIFDKFHITPPKGVLFHGPPGTGKTLIARALANECSQGDRKVTFFMRKGADCLSKWVGESERQLRLLFEQAFQKKPSIIFFDEIDGLAPVRSSKQDQIHASIVATLLALMDGLDSRGEVIVIGATNRIDAIDPALRRPGRFDRELYFPLPACKERQEILKIHVNKWENIPDTGLISELAEQSSGYCGSDLRALCTESVIQALRRTYPQIYKSSQKLLLDTHKVQVGSVDFACARASIIPASHRVAPSPAHKLKSFLEPLISTTLDAVMNHIKEIFPHSVSRDVNMKISVHRPRLLLSGTNAQQAQTTHLAPAVLHSIEHIPVHTLDLGTLYEVSARSPEETVSQIFQEARRSPPSVIYMPSLGQWWDLIPQTVQAVFLMHLEKLDMMSPVFLLATCDSSYEKVSHEIRNLFSLYRDEVIVMTNPKESEREAFFHPLLLEKTVAEPDPPKPTEDSLEELPLAPPPEPAKLTEEELQKLYDKEEHTLRELRIFLREVCAKLARNRMFFMFTKPVDVMEVPDYFDIIEQPMDLETMMTKIDQHQYVCAREFLNDVDLICRNALEYNPARDQADKLIRHRACFLRDTAYALIKAEMDSDFEDRCRAISTDRKKRKDSPSRFVPAPLEFIHTERAVSSRGVQLNSEKDGTGQVANGDLSSHSSIASNTGLLSNGVACSSARKRRQTGWSRGLIPKKRKNRKIDSLTGKQEPSDRTATVNEAFDSSSHLSTSAANSHGDLSVTCSPSSALVRHSSSFSHHHGDSGSPIAKNCSSVNGMQEHSLSDVEMKEEKSSRGKRSSLEIGSVEQSKSLKQPSQNGRNDPKPERRSELSGSSNDTKTATAPLSSPHPAEVIIDCSDLEKLLAQVVSVTNNCAVETLIELYVRFEKVIARYQSKWNRSCLPELLRLELKRFQQHHQ